MGAKAFGEQNPTAGEDAVSWQTWSDGAAGIPTVDGNADWGKLKLDLSGEEGRSAVYDLGSEATRKFTLTENRYGTGDSVPALLIRGSAAAFSQDDATPAWVGYTAPLSRSWRYVQVMSSTNYFELPVNMATAAATLIEDFENVDDWTLAGTGATKEANTSQFKTGTQSIKVTTGTGGGVNFTRDWGSGRNLSGVGRVGLWVYWHNAYPIGSVISNWSLQFSSVSNFATYKYYSLGSSGHIPGWEHIQAPLTKFTDSGGESWTNIRYVRITFGSQAGQVASCSLDSLEYGQASYPGIMIFLDDGFDSVVDIAYAKMNPLGMRGNVAVITDNVGQADTCSWAELQTLEAAGWIVASHGTDHTDLTTLSETDQETEIDAARDALAAGGIIQPNYLVYPWGTWNADTLTACANQGILLARDTGNTARVCSLPVFHPYLNTCISCTDATTLDDLKGYIDAAIAGQYICSVYTHDIGTAGDLSQANFEGMIDYLVTKRDQIYILTMDDLYKLQTGAVVVLK